ncbi:23S rRNA (adenine(2030)-N(6))-methyltransferase RlmJ [Robbsia sp. Bb-Pol-6]|uniref:Ribosomal RNA large subunit methyltransferase J n=1 Tax=Robbsia betulipollinis TaxID=2981849 RepID=A0ABT3ZMQ5_9BURK|nr:23S rRNA (adenine(2030)-N(6))-methyltransferase RlmJ [Robbsia betulipollinis]MCY0387781.1 23S rRNA (adenine(2030)-N(6))-methyltransferase RlmJ [Robbsia betulipollinis]
MFSYRHGFHAGNHADVLKHAILVSLLQYMARKDKAYWYIDTHAGAGAYSLVEGFAAKREEFGNGIGRLWGRSDLPPAPPMIADYLAAVATMNPDGALRYYPGSPYLAWQHLREQDRMRLFELHPSEIDILGENFDQAGKRAILTRADGFDAVRSVLPPPTRRALMLIDPSYEDKQDYGRTLDSLVESVRRFPSGTYAVWYPIVTRAEALAFPRRLRELGFRSWLDASLSISAAPADGFGLYGSGLFIVNPPFVLEGELRDVLPWLVDTLGQDAQARFTLDAVIP